MKRTYTIRVEIQAEFAKKVGIRRKAKEIVAGWELPGPWKVVAIASRSKAQPERASPPIPPPTDEEVQVQMQMEVLRAILSDMHRIRPNVTKPWLELWPNRWCRRPYARMPRGAHAHQDNFWVVSRNAQGIRTGQKWKAAKGLICINPREVLRTLQVPDDDEPHHYGPIRLMAHEFSHLVVPARAHRSGKFQATEEDLIIKYRAMKAGTWTPTTIVPGWRKTEVPVLQEVSNGASGQ